jgi:tRNA nucleotidyltransferase (CCA-adding enzyme)
MPLPEPVTAAVERAPADVPLRLCALLDGLSAPGELLARLKFPNKVIDEVALLLSSPPPGPAPAATDAELRRWMARIGRTEVPRALALQKARAPGEAAAALERRCGDLLAQAPPLSTRELALQGRQIMAVLGVPPSPIVGEATRFLFDRVLDDPGLNQPATLTGLLRNWAKAQGL